MDKTRAIGPDLLRGLAILLVASAHMPMDKLPPAFWTFWGQFGWLGVDIFFVLSGYLIGSELLKPVERGTAPDLRVFYLKRVLRILPVFWLMVALYFAFPVLQEGATIAPPWRFLTFTLNFGLDIRTERTFSHAWSLCVEEHFYLVLPVLILLFRGLRWKGLPIVFAAAVVIGGLVLRHMLYQSMPTGHDAVQFLKTIYYPSYCRLDGLVMGVSLAGLRLFYPSVWAKLARPLVLLPLACLCFAITGYLNVRTGEILNELGSVVFYPLFSLGVAMTLMSVLQLEPKLQALRWTGLGYIAQISYSFYLCQKMVYHADGLWLPKACTQGWLGVAVYYVTAILAASLLFFVVERSFLRLRQHWLKRFSVRQEPVIT